MTNSIQQAEKKFWELLRGFDFAMLVTQSPSAELHARPMAIAEIGEDGSVWFLSGTETNKVFELVQNAHAVAVMQGGSRYLSVTGLADLVQDREHVRRLWRESFRVWFKDKDDPNIMLIRLRPREGEYWDQHGVQGLKFALRFAKAYVTGEDLREQERNDVATHAKLPL